MIVTTKPPKTLAYQGVLGLFTANHRVTPATCDLHPPDRTLAMAHALHVGKLWHITLTVHRTPQIPPQGHKG